MRRRRRGAAGGGGALAGVALGLAALALALTLALAVVCARGPRELPDETPDDPSLELAPPQPRSPREPHPPPMEQAGARRHRRTATKGKRLRPRKSAPTPLYAAHYEVQPADGQTGIYTAGPDGTIRGWAESRLNASSPLRYDEARGVFTVTHGGLYYVYAQAHFDEAAWVYVKLELALGAAPALRCLHQLPPPSAGPPEPQLRGCRVAGLLRLPSGATLRLGTVPRVRLKPDASLTHLGLFQLR